MWDFYIRDNAKLYRMYIRVKAFPNAGKEVVEKLDDHRLQICVREPATDNRANKRIIEIVASHYNIPTNTVRIISGHHRPNKLLQIHSS